MDKIGVSKKVESQKINLDFSQDYSGILKNLEGSGEISIFSEAKSNLIERCCICDGADNYYIFKNIDNNFRIFLKKLCENKNISKNVFNLKKFYKSIMTLRINFMGEIFDVLLAAYLLNPEIKEDIFTMAQGHEIFPPDLPEELTDEEKKCIETCYFIAKLKDLYKIKIKENSNY